MTAEEVQLKLDYNAKWFKQMPWQTQVQIVVELLDALHPVEEVARLLKTTPRWIRDCIKVSIALEHRQEWNCKHARSMQQAVLTCNLRRAKENRSKMEALASEATTSARTIFG